MICLVTYHIHAKLCLSHPYTWKIPFFYQLISLFLNPQWYLYFKFPWGFSYLYLQIIYYHTFILLFLLNSCLLTNLVLNHKPTIYLFIGNLLIFSDFRSTFSSTNLTLFFNPTLPYPQSTFPVLDISPQCIFSWSDQQLSPFPPSFSKFFLYLLCGSIKSISGPNRGRTLRITGKITSQLLKWLIQVH